MIPEWYFWEIVGQCVGITTSVIVYYGIYRLVYARYLLLAKRRFMWIGDKPDARGRRTVLGLRELERAGVVEAKFDTAENVWKTTNVGGK